ncbi:MAG: hypothetical protein QOF58_6687, partial [Pseudonocardiales bacterium]|nr:hypothetical protein [Pseudonocardiales bacterium]
DDGGERALFRIDPMRRVCLRTNAEPPQLPRGTHLLLLTRPWLSMRKYGRRGHRYAQLDTAHLAVNLLGTALASGAEAELRLRLRRRTMRAELGLLAVHREPHSLLTLRPSPGAAPSGWRFRTGAARRQDDLLEELESLCWNDLPHAEREELPGQVSPGALVAGRGTLPMHQWPALARERRSSKGFSAGAIAVDEVVSVAGTPLPTDLEPSPRLAVDVFTPRAQDRDRLVRACHDQEHLRHAAAFALFHTATCTDPHLLREDLFRAGAIGQLLYLGATARRTGVTGVGGFNPRAWQELAGLPASREVLYLVALGRGGDQATKLDRAERAAAHGE